MIVAASERFRRLSVEHRAVVVLHHYLDMTVPEITETLSRSSSRRSPIPGSTPCEGLRAALDAVPAPRRESAR